jgi:hypothetical protein
MLFLLQASRRGWDESEQTSDLQLGTICLQVVKWKHFNREIFLCHLALEPNKNERCTIPFFFLNQLCISHARWEDTYSLDSG